MGNYWKQTNAMQAFFYTCGIVPCMNMFKGMCHKTLFTHHGLLEAFRFWDENNYENILLILLTHELASFWQKNVIAIIILLQVLARLL